MITLANVQAALERIRRGDGGFEMLFSVLLNLFDFDHDDVLSQTDVTDLPGRCPAP